MEEIQILDLVTLWVLVACFMAIVFRKNLLVFSMFFAHAITKTIIILNF